jgi:hypothetical protein
MSDKPTAPERVQSAFRQLSEVATGLNTASDELGKTIAELEASIQKLNLGVSVWVQIAGNEDEHGNFWSREIGYVRIGGRWVIALRKAAGNFNTEDEQEETWSFNDSPRWMRVEGVGKIPDLLEALAKQAAETTGMIKKKTAEAKELAAAIKGAPAVKTSQVESRVTPQQLSAVKDAVAALAKTAPRK